MNVQYRNLLEDEAGSTNPVDYSTSYSEIAKFLSKREIKGLLEEEL